MRTTLTLDDDVARFLRQEMRRSNLSLKAAVNHFLRLGMVKSKHVAARSFKVKPRKLGLPPGLSYDNVEELLQAIEGPAHK